MRLTGTSSKLILALDISDSKEALRIVDKLSTLIQIFKIGSTLFTASGPSILDEIRKRGAEVFLDLKYHDIPHTVADAIRQAVKHDVKMITLHTLGGIEMMKQGVEVVQKAAGSRPPLLLGVTVLTSFEQNSMQETLQTPLSVTEMVLHLAQTASDTGLDGVVASPWEVALLRKNFPSPFKLVTPGIRPKLGQKQDQNRSATAKQAITDGADYIVVGRPILESKNMVRATEAILAEIKQIP